MDSETIHPTTDREAQLNSIESLGLDHAKEWTAGTENGEDTAQCADRPSHMRQGFSSTTLRTFSLDHVMADRYSSTM
jgi:hypothetical protein